MSTHSLNGEAELGLECESWYDAADDEEVPADAEEEEAEHVEAHFKACACPLPFSHAPHLIAQAFTFPR
jgi:hypothetical protein